VVRWIKSSLTSELDFDLTHEKGVTAMSGRMLGPLL
jgi:hypothetical protein